MKKIKLNQKQRLITAFLYTVIVAFLFSTLVGNIFVLINNNDPICLWFISGILLVVLGKYVSEPYFTTPADSLINGISLFLALLGVTDKNIVIGYWPLFVMGLFICILSIIHIFIKDSATKVAKISYWILKTLGSSKFIFSIVYFSASFSFFINNIPMLIASLMLWVFMVPIDSIGYFVNWFSNISYIFKKDNNSSRIGKAVKNADSLTYIVSVDKNIRNEKNIGSYDDNVFFIKKDTSLYYPAIETNRVDMLDKLWVNLLLIDKDVSFTFEDLKTWGINCQKNEDIGTTYISKLSKLPEEKVNFLLGLKIFKNRKLLIGFVLEESDINTLRFRLCIPNDTRVKEGTIVETLIFGKPVLYQVINCVTKVVSNERNNNEGYLCVIARKLGSYDYSKKDLVSLNWVPVVNEPIYLKCSRDLVDPEILAMDSIGVLPDSDMQIQLKDVNSLVTHNTAILGVLGVGKSCLTFELIKKLIKSGVKIICFDITNQYASQNGLYKYISENEVLDNVDKSFQDDLTSSSTKRGNIQKPEEWGNVQEFQNLIQNQLDCFFSDNKHCVWVINPDLFDVKSAASAFNIAGHKDLSVVEKTKIISEIILKKCMDLGQTDKARCCVIYEEAHSIIPEFNSVVLKEDINNANGVAKVILQGRKFGLGCIVVAQRTANVTKSILNQCNTIFALRVFDDTGKSFLENYMGKEYTDVLPTLEERRAVAVGKGIGLKQPVIIQLNDSKYLTDDFDNEN